MDLAYHRRYLRARHLDIGAQYLGPQHPGHYYVVADTTWDTQARLHMLWSSCSMPIILYRSFCTTLLRKSAQTAFLLWDIRMGNDHFFPFHCRILYCTTLLSIDQAFQIHPCVEDWCVYFLRAWDSFTRYGHRFIWFLRNSAPKCKFWYPLIIDLFLAAKKFNYQD